LDFLAEVRAGRRHLPVDARLELAGKKRVVLRFPRTASSPRHSLAHETHCAPRLIAGGIETHLP
jgi:hypothetical protein